MRAARLDMGGVFGAPFDERFWEANSPFTLARQNAAALETLRIYFDCGDQDEYGFDAGARALDRLLTARGVAHEFHIYGGGHSWAYVMDHFGDGVVFAARGFRGEAGTGKNH
jgi:S-formylglutathione hydrolase FrmB